MNGGHSPSGRAIDDFSTAHSGNKHEEERRERGKVFPPETLQHVYTLWEKDSLARLTRYMLEKAIIDEPQKQSIHPAG